MLINLSAIPRANALRIVLDAPRARHSAEPLSNEILRIVRSSSTSDGRIRIATGLFAIALGVVLLLAIPADNGVLHIYNATGMPRLICGTVALALGVVMAVVAKGSSFDSPKARRLRDWQTWLARLVLGACVLIPAAQALMKLVQGG